MKTEDHKIKYFTLKTSEKRTWQREINGENRVTRNPNGQGRNKQTGGDMEVRVTWFLRTVDGERIMSFILEFKGAKLPERIKIGFLSFPVPTSLFHFNVSNVIDMDT